MTSEGMSKRSSTSGVSVGTLISFPCSVNDGAVSSEKFVECNVSGQNDFLISGAVSTRYVNPNTGQVVGVVTDKPSQGYVQVLFNGEIFSPGNPVNIPLSYIREKCTILPRA